MLSQSSHSPSVLSLLSDLVGFPTVSHNANIALIDYVEAYLSRYGVVCRRFPSEDGSRVNLHAVIGPADVPGMMLSGHTDTVSVEGQVWQGDPFRLREHEGRLYGRGTTDMKGFLAAVLAAVPRMVDAQLARPIHLAFSYDEEIGCVGVRPMIEGLKELAVRPFMCIVGEPTSMQVAIGHKGKLAARCTCHGVAAHSAMPTRGVNAIYMATDVIAAIRDVQSQVHRSAQENTTISALCTTLHVGTISGGTALNIVPELARFDFEIRNVPTDDPLALLDRINHAARKIEQAACADFPHVAIDIAVQNAYPALDMPAQDAAVKLATRLTGMDATTRVDFGTEAGLFQQGLDIPVVVCGPGSMEQGHKRDEFIEIDQLANCSAFLENLIEELRSP